MFKVHRKPWGLSGSPIDVFDPTTWCGAVTTLCAGDVETPSLGGEAPWWRRHQSDQGSLASAFVVSLCGKSSGALGRDLVTGSNTLVWSASTTWTRGGLVPTDTMR
jgi:hypothetical protein